MLLGNDQHVRSLLRDSNNDQAANFLGQHALHCAIYDTQNLAFLLQQFDCQKDIPDKGGSTPLMYAMSYGFIDAANMLLEAGADPFVRDERNRFCALDYALARGGIGDFESLLCLFESLQRLSIDTDEALLYCVRRSMFQFQSFTSEQYKQLLAIFTNSGPMFELTTRNGNTLLHLCNDSWLPAFLEYPGWRVNHKNRHGYTPLMVHSHRYDPVSIIKLLESGAKVLDTDEAGQNVLHHLISGLSRHCSRQTPGDDWRDMFRTAALLLSHGASVIGEDNCVCSCSVSGCMALTYHFHQCHWSKPQSESLKAIPWLLEWWILLTKLQPESMKAVASALFRRQRFDELGMTHTCCLRKEVGYLGTERWCRPFWCERGHIQQDNILPGKDDEAEDLREIREEEEEEAQKLQTDHCNISSSIQDATVEPENIFITLLARRALMLEERLIEARAKDLLGKEADRRSQVSTLREIVVGLKRKRNTYTEGFSG